MNNLVKYIVAVLNVPLVVLFDFHQTVLLAVDLYVVVLRGIRVKMKPLHHVGNPITQHPSKALIDKHLVNMAFVFIAKAIYIDIVGKSVIGMTCMTCIIGIGYVSNMNIYNSIICIWYH